MEIFRLFKLSKKQFYVIRKCLNTLSENPYLVIENRDPKINNVFISDKISNISFDKLGVFSDSSFTRPILLRKFLRDPKVFCISESSCKVLPPSYDFSWFIQINGVYMGSKINELFNNTKYMIHTNEKELLRWIIK